MKITFNVLHFLWIIPLIANLGYFIAATMFSSSDKDKEDACKRCWSKWQCGFHPNEPGVKDWQRADEDS